MASRHAGTHNAFMARMVDIRVKDLLKDLKINNIEVTSIPIVRWINKLKYEKDGRTLRHVTELVYNHAIRRDSNPWIDAKLCLKIYEDMSPEFQDEKVVDRNGVPITGGCLFLRFLVDLCMRGFERVWPPSGAGGGTVDESENGEVSDTTRDEKKQEEEEEKSGGVELMKFMGQLFLLDMITEEIMHDCVQDLLTRTDGHPDEMTLESLCELLEIVGQVLEAKTPDIVDAYFQCLEDWTNSAIDTKLRERMQTLVEFRRNGWLKARYPVRKNGVSARASKWRDTVNSHFPSVSFSKLNPGRSNEAQQGTFATNRANAPFIARSPSAATTSWEPPTPTSPTQVTLPRNEPNWRLSQKPGRDLSSEAPTHRRKLQLLPRSQQHTITPSPHSVSNNQLPSPVSAAPQRDTASNDLASTMNWRYRQHNDEDEVSWRSYPHSALRKNQRTKNPRWTRDKEIDQVNQNIHEFFVVSEDLDAAISRFSRLAVEDQYIFIHRIVSFSIKSDSADVKFVSDFLGRIKGNLFSSRMLEEAFRPTAENLKDIGWKFPNARMNFVKLLEAAGLDPGETLARLVRVIDPW